MYHAYPLRWPPGWDRTPVYARTPARFSSYGERLTIAVALTRLEDALRVMGARNAILSSDLPRRANGTVRQDRAGPLDSGAVLHWQDQASPMVLAADHHPHIADNLAALAKSLEALHALRRHGGERIAARSFAGFAALPPPPAERPGWAQVLDLDPATATADEVHARFRNLARDAHPDARTGSHELMTRVVAARDAALAAISAGPRPC